MYVEWREEGEITISFLQWVLGAVSFTLQKGFVALTEHGRERNDLPYSQYCLFMELDSLSVPRIKYSCQHFSSKQSNGRYKFLCRCITMVQVLFSYSFRNISYFHS